MSSYIQLKDTNFGVRITFSNECADDLLVKDFEEIPEEAYRLPAGAGAALDFMSRPCSEELIYEMQLSPLLEPLLERRDLLKLRFLRGVERVFEGLVVDGE